MREIVVLAFQSLDGVVQAPGGSGEDTSGGFELGGWSVPFADEASGRLMSEQLGQPFDLLLGRWTYELFASYWPSAPEESFVTGAFAKAVKHVVSSTLTAGGLTWAESRPITGADVVGQLRALKAGDGPMLQVHGSRTLVQTLLAAGLVDQLWLKTYPVLLGKGKRLYADDAAPTGFELTGAEATPGGIVFANYRNTGDVRTGSF